MAEENTNIFIEFQVVINSDPSSLYRELDLLIAAGKRIFLWSKTVTPEMMERHAKKLKIPIPKEDLKEHKECWELKNKERLTYQEIADKLKIPLKKVSYYTRNDPDRDWNLDDWIVDYYQKDSSVYPRVDILVDNDERLVNRFKRAGREANLVERV